MGDAMKKKKDEKKRKRDEYGSLPSHLPLVLSRVFEFKFPPHEKHSLIISGMEGLIVQNFPTRNTQNGRISSSYYFKFGCPNFMPPHSFIHSSIHSIIHSLYNMCILYGLGGHYYFDYQYDRGNNYMPRFRGFLGINRKFKENETALLKVT